MLRYGYYGSLPYSQPSSPLQAASSPDQQQHYNQGPYGSPDQQSLMAAMMGLPPYGARCLLEIPAG